MVPRCFSMDWTNAPNFDFDLRQNITDYNVYKTLQKSASYKLSNLFIFPCKTIIACGLQSTFDPLLHQHKTSQWILSFERFFYFYFIAILEDEVRRSPPYETFLTLNSDPALYTHAFTGRVHSESLQRAEKRTIHTAVSGDTHLSISRWIIEGTPPPPCFLHGLELVAVAGVQAPPPQWDSKGEFVQIFGVFAHAAWVARLFFYLSIPRLYLCCFPLALVSHPVDSYQNWFPCAHYAQALVLMHRLRASLSISPVSYNNLISQVFFCLFWLHFWRTQRGDLKFRAFFVRFVENPATWKHFRCEGRCNTSLLLNKKMSIVRPPHSCHGVPQHCPPPPDNVTAFEVVTEVSVPQWLHLPYSEAETCPTCLKAAHTHTISFC